MQNCLGVLLLFFIQLFYLNLGIYGVLSKKEKKKANDIKPILLKWTGFYVWKLEGKKIYKLMMFLIYFLLFCNSVCICVLKFYETYMIHTILDLFIKTSFLLVPFLIVLNYFFSKNHKQ